MSGLNAHEIFDARFNEKLSWNSMRERFGGKGNSTGFYALMVPHVTTKAGTVKAAFKDTVEANAALSRAVERAAAAKVKPAK